MRTIYHSGNSYLHRLNPLGKLAVCLPLMMLMLLTSEPWTPLAFSFVIIVILLGPGKLPAHQFLRTLAPILVLVLFFLLLYPLLIRSSLVDDTPLVFKLGPLAVYEGGVYQGATSAARVFALLVLALPFSLTTDSADFVRALVQQWRLPYRLGYSTLAAFRFAPMMRSEIAVLAAAHRIRGVNGVHGVRGWLERLRRYTVPLLATSIRHAERSALAMDGRAFGAFPQRTFFRRMSMGAADWTFIAGMLMTTVVVLLALQAAGLLGPFAFVQIL